MKLSIDYILNSIKIGPYGPDQKYDSFHRFFYFQEKASILKESVKTSATNVIYYFKINSKLITRYKCFVEDVTILKKSNLWRHFIKTIKSDSVLLFAFWKFCQNNFLHGALSPKKDFFRITLTHGKIS